ncbi:MAG: aminomethyl-transferring glycine dehydrogenase subunit GcvPB, partial [Candidatus Omnitrophica bacterium]|nr:aminomethyl-transferring glycine dehydrogenase subunit GcvPB [Candidatus Omnitrophota bacterium]
LRAHLGPKTAGIMLTNPSTLGVFERQIKTVAALVHEAGGLLYYDGANLNAILGRCRPGDLGFDVMHINTHKTFTTPHGGGGPGAGPVGVNKKLEPFLPISRVIKTKNGHYALDYDYPESIGYISSFYGNFALLLRAYSYILLLGKEGLQEVSNHAVLNANYIKERLRSFYELPFTQYCMHECVFSAKRQAARGVHAVDIAKYLIDLGFHPPTVYFPLTVKESIMIEPTETESKTMIDDFISAMEHIDQITQSSPEDFHNRPKTTPVTRPDEVKAARDLNTNYFNSPSV